MNYDRPELLDRLAAAYVFGTLPGPARRRFARLRSKLPAADAAACAWEARTAPLAAPVEAVMPSPQLWRDVERRIGAAPPQASRTRRWWQPAFAFAFGLLAAVGLVRLMPELAPPPAAQGVAPSYVGILLDAEGKVTALASSLRHGRRMTIRMVRPVTVPAGKVLQLWALPETGAPVPLGVLPNEPKGGFDMAATSEQLLSDVSRLAVSVENGPQRPGAVPSAFILSGHCAKLW